MGVLYLALLLALFIAEQFNDSNILIINSLKFNLKSQINSFVVKLNCLINITHIEEFPYLIFS